jgi:uncharacterized membrane protein YebE (DUF533 family)
MSPRLIDRLFGREGPEPDGVARVLEAHAQPALAELETEADAETEPASLSRRQRPLAPGEEILAEAMAEKVLDAWLRNRHQTLHPLTVNVRPFEAARVALLVQLMAVALLAGPQQPEPSRIEAAEAWLRAAGAAENEVAALRAALTAPPALSTLLGGLADADLAAMGYVFALCAADRRDSASRLFTDYLATRLALPASVVRSANRRYGR